MRDGEVLALTTPGKRISKDRRSCVSKPRLPTQTLDHAKQLRKGMTDAERRLWQYLRAGRLEGMKFRRQHPVPPYIVDFCCVEAGLVVELDGSQHSPAADAARTRYLQSQGGGSCGSGTTMC